MTDAGGPSRPCECPSRDEVSLGESGLAVGHGMREVEGDLDSLERGWQGRWLQQIEARDLGAREAL